MKPWETDDTFLARWMSGELAPEELRAFEESPDYAQFQHITGAMDDLSAPAYNENAALSKIKSRIADSKKPQGKVIPMRSFYRYAAAACAVLAIGIAAFFLLTDSTFELTADARQQVDLPDGSVIQVNEGSTIAYDTELWEQERTVRMDGEAFFDVEKGSTFKVELESGTVTVLGTSFNILEENGKLAVTCYTGKVKVEAYGQEEILTPGEAVAIASENDKTNITTQLEQPAWITGVITLKEVPLSEAVAQFEEIYTVELEGNYDGNLTFSGTFPVDDIEVALKQLFGPFGIQWQRVPDTNRIRIE